MAFLRGLLLFPLGIFLAATTVTAQSNPAAQNTSSSTACADLHIIVVRASNEVPSQGRIGTLADLITAANPGSSVEWIPYPATLVSYDTSSYNGTLSTTSHLTNYVDSCSKASIVLLGYSQGAHVVGDVMCGGGLALGLGPYSPPIDSKYANKVLAMIQMGDPRFMLNMSFDVGTSNSDGIFPRPANISCEKYAGIIQSYCDADDPFCARGLNLTVHQQYTNKYNNDAFNFVQGKIRAKAAAASSSSAPGTSPTKTSSSSSSSSTSTNSSNGGNSSTSAAIAWTGSRNTSPYLISLTLAVTLGALFTFGV